MGKNRPILMGSLFAAGALVGATVDWAAVVGATVEGGTVACDTVVGVSAGGTLGTVVGVALLHDESTRATMTNAKPRNLTFFIFFFLLLLDTEHG
jgi:hypothetical protein